MKKILILMLSVLIYTFITGCVQNMDLNQVPKLYDDCKEYFDARGEYHNSCKNSKSNTTTSK